MIKRNKPNFLIVGAAKAGTTSLAKYLNEHKDIFIPEKKEIRYFVNETLLKTNLKDPMIKGIIDNSVLDKNEYYKIFDVNEKLAGEASVHYLYNYKTAIPKILKEIGDIPIIIIIRNPVDRAISNWQFVDLDNDSFEKSLVKEHNRISENYDSFWYYRDLGFYYNSINEYMKSFSNVKVILFDELKKRTDDIVKETLVFLGVDPNVNINSKVIYNKRKGYRPKSFFKFIAFSQRFRNIILELLMIFKIEKIVFVEKSKKIDETIKQKLLKDYIPDIEKLEELLGVDLKNWK